MLRNMNHFIDRNLIFYFSFSKN